MNDSEEQPGECVPRCALGGLARVDGGGRGEDGAGAGSCERGGDMKLVSGFLPSLFAQLACLRLSSLRHLPRVPPFLYTVTGIRTAYPFRGGLIRGQAHKDRKSDRIRVVKQAPDSRARDRRGK
jgi:hypothetical protein